MKYIFSLLFVRSVFNSFKFQFLNAAAFDCSSKVPIIGSMFIFGIGLGKDVYDNISFVTDYLMVMIFIYFR